MKTRSEQSRKLFSPLDKETINAFKFGKTERFGLGVVHGEEVTEKVRISLTRFVCTDFSAPNSPSLVTRLSSSSWYYRVGTCHIGDFMILQGRMRWERSQ